MKCIKHGMKLKEKTNKLSLVYSNNRGLKVEESPLLRKEGFLQRIRRAFTDGRYLVRFHAHVRMRGRGILVSDALRVIQDGEIVEFYPDARPYPSCLILGMVGSRPIHVVCALSPEGIGFLVTAYIPSLEEWEPDYRRRKK